ncbi:hypothetical protein BC940DRAFT_302726 [Gongronella butleri]|nr:hypothetical protein BC940DRAFT_302726 [Gongronella butleri]
MPLSFDDQRDATTPISLIPGHLLWMAPPLPVNSGQWMTAEEDPERPDADRQPAVAPMVPPEAGGLLFQQQQQQQHLPSATNRTYALHTVSPLKQKRPRRRYSEIERHYACIWPECSKAYGTLTHLNAHIIAQGHVGCHKLEQKEG